ncbi:MAG: hypothetical protein GSR77_06155 [Desulfurococcales archaeon]|nr:hypothetical protein [Desulfurococcales archaeon]
MYNFAGSRPRELQPIQFREIIKTGYERVEDPGELRKPVYEALNVFDELCNELGEKCAIRLVFEADSNNLSDYYYEIRLLRRSPDNYIIITNIDENFDKKSIYGVSYEIFTVSDDMIDIEITRATSLQALIIYSNDIETAFTKLLVLLGYDDKLNIVSKRQNENTVKQDNSIKETSNDVLGECTRYMSEKNPSIDATELLLNTILDGMGYYKDTNGLVYCLTGSKDTENNKCRYYMIILKDKEIIDTKCYHDSNDFFSSFRL